MIQVSRLNGEPFLLNAERIRYVEARPDTLVTLDGGERVVVRESPDEILRRCLDYQRSKHALPEPRRPSGVAPSRPSLRGGTA